MSRLNENFKWESVTAVASAAVALIALVAAAFTLQQIRDFKASTKIERLVQEVNYFDSPTFVAVRKNLAWKRLAQDGNLTPLDPSDPPPEMYAVLNYFDYIGLLQERGYLDEDDVWESFGYWIDFYYADSIQVIAEERKKESKNDYKKFEALAKKMQFLDDRKGEEPGVPPPKRIADFYSYEKDQPIGEPPQPWPTLQKNRTSGRSKSK